MSQHEYVINGKRYVVEVVSFDGRNADVRVNGTSYKVEVPATSRVRQAAPAPVAAATTSPAPPQPVKSPAPAQPVAPQPTPKAPAAPPPQPESGQTDNQVVSPMPGVILNVLVLEGQTVAAGEALLVLEAMKMENEIHAPRAGTVKKIHTPKGTEVRAGTLLVELEA